MSRKSRNDKNILVLLKLPGFSVLLELGSQSWRPKQKYAIFINIFENIEYIFNYEICQFLVILNDPRIRIHQGKGPDPKNCFICYIQGADDKLGQFLDQDI
jgi:hypothetical protein